MTREAEIVMARKFFDHLYYNEIEQGTDVVYEFIDPEFEYGDELCDYFNNATAKEVIALGFKQKYGVDWHENEKKEG